MIRSRIGSGLILAAVLFGLSHACLKTDQPTRISVEEKSGASPGGQASSVRGLAAPARPGVPGPAGRQAGEVLTETTVPPDGFAETDPRAIPDAPGPGTAPDAAAPPAPEVFPVNKRANGLFLQGTQAFREKNYVEAAGLFEASLNFKTGWEDYALYYLLRSRWEGGDVQGTVSGCRQFRDRFPQSPLLGRVRGLEAQCYLKNPSQWGLALQAYEELLQQQDRSEPRLRLAGTQENLGRLSEAWANYRRVRQKWPGTSAARLAKRRMREIEKKSPQLAAAQGGLRPLLDEADLCLREGDGDEALSLYRQVLARQPPAPVAREALRGEALALIRAGRLEQALDPGRRLRERYPGSREDVECAFAVGRELWRKNRREEAWPVLERLVDQFTDTAEAMQASFILGRIREELGDRGSAMDQYRRTRFLYPGTEWEQEAAWREAWCHYRNGNHDACASLLLECENKGVWVGELLPRARYWRARCLELSGERSLANPLYELTSRQHPDSFYGNAAEKRLRGLPLLSDLTGEARSVSVPPEPVAAEKVLARLADPAVPLLLEAGMPGEAADRLNWLQGRGDRPRMRPEDWIEAYALAGAHAKSIGLARSGGHLNRLLAAAGPGTEAIGTLRMIFPLPYWETIRSECARKHLDPFLVAGLIHQESLFMSDAVSPAGAIGLMQIMPATGREVARKLGISGFRTSTLRDPKVNIRIGTAYLAGLAERYGNQWHKVLANYNAGPTPVARWTAAMPEAAIDEFVEGINYRETRIYVKKVLLNASVYLTIYGRARQTRAPS